MSDNSDAAFAEALLLAAKNELMQLHRDRAQLSDDLVPLAMQQIRTARETLELRRRWNSPKRRPGRAGT